MACDQQPPEGEPLSSGSLDSPKRNWWNTITRADLLELRSRILMMLAHKQLGNSDELEDAVQDALVGLLVNRTAVNPQNNGLVRFAFVVARNRLLDRRRQKQPREPLPENLMGTNAPVDAGTMEQQAQVAQIFFYELDPLDRYMLWRHVVDELPTAQVAAEVGLYWHKAAERIRSALERLRWRIR